MKIGNKYNWDSFKKKKKPVCFLLMAEDKNLSSLYTYQNS